MKKLLILSLSTFVLTTAASAYDANKAQELNKFYSHITHKACAHSKLFISANDVMKMYKDGKDFTVVDLRTDGEANIIALSNKNAIHIPIAKLFTKENLDKLPTNKPLILVCHSGARALMAAVGLKQLGFKNTQVLKGGLVALAQANNPKNAPEVK
jgi:rhodanese-related sulfurtransferase